MTLWTIDLPEYPRDVFVSCTPEEVLIEYDQPLTFTFRDRYGRLLLAHLADEDDVRARYIAAATSDRIVARLKAGALSIREALDQPATWIVDVEQESGAIVAAWTIALEDLPGSVLPEPAVMLYPDLERELVFDEQGVIEEADRRHQTFILRDVPDLDEQKCRYAAEISDDVMRAFASGQRVRVLGVRPATSSIVSAVQIVPLSFPAVVVQA